MTGACSPSHPSITRLSKSKRKSKGKGKGKERFKALALQRFNVFRFHSFACRAVASCVGGSFGIRASSFARIHLRNDNALAAVFCSLDRLPAELQVERFG